MLPALYDSIWTDPDGTRHWILAVYECRIVEGSPPLSEDFAAIDADSGDGTGPARFSHMREAIHLAATEPKLFDRSDIQGDNGNG